MQTKMRSAPSPGDSYLAHTTDFFIFQFHFYFYFIFLLYFLSLYVLGDYGIMPWVMIGEIGGSYDDNEKIDRQSHSWVWEEEGRGCRDGYGVRKMLSFVHFVWLIASRRKYRQSKRRK
jgi:hypothetical protein